MVLRIVNETRRRVSGVLIHGHTSAFLISYNDSDQDGNVMKRKMLSVLVKMQKGYRIAVLGEAKSQI